MLLCYEAKDGYMSESGLDMFFKDYQLEALKYYGRQMKGCFQELCGSKSINGEANRTIILFACNSNHE